MCLYILYLESIKCTISKKGGMINVYLSYEISLCHKWSDDTVEIYDISKPTAPVRVHRIVIRQL
jgi:hypothetical protein